MVSARLTAIIFLAYFASAAVSQPQKPYAPDLFARSDLDDSNREQRMMRRAVSGAVDEASSSSLNKRSPSLHSTSWSPMEFLGLREFSEEELHSRGQVPDDVIEKRGRCSSDSSCSSSQYCSSKTHRCYKKLNTGKGCSRNGACSTGYCCESTGKCEAKRSIGAKCHQNNSACNSSYCSVKTNTCKTQSSHGGGCIVDSGCKGSLTCVNRTCKTGKPSKGGNHHGSKPQPHKPSPSGSHWDKRDLRAL